MLNLKLLIIFNIAAGATDKQGNREYATRNHAQSMQHKTINLKPNTEYSTINHSQSMQQETNHRVYNKKLKTEYTIRNQKQSIQ